MTMDPDAAFAVIQRELETFNADVGKACAEQAQAKETIDSVEYEMEQLRRLIAENALPQPAERRYAQLLSDVQVLGENVGGGLLRRLLGRAA
jgi:chromosome segregation ATPase